MYQEKQTLPENGGGRKSQTNFGMGSKHGFLNWVIQGLSKFLEGTGSLEDARGTPFECLIMAQESSAAPMLDAPSDRLHFDHLVLQIM